MKKVIFTKSPSCEPWNLGYDEGDTATVKNDVADDLIRAKFAVDFDDEAAQVEASSGSTPELTEEAKKAAEQKAQAIADAEVGKVTLAEVERANAEAAAKEAGLQERAIQDAKKEAEIEKAELHADESMEKAVEAAPVQKSTKKSTKK